MKCVSRRSVLRAGLALVVCGASGTLTTRVRRRTPDSAVRHLAAVLRDSPSAAVVGDQYLLAYPLEADRDRLLERVCDDIGAAPDDVTATSAVELRRRLRDRSRGDFGRGDIVVVGGWVLARSEARLCGLLALDDAGRMKGTRSCVSAS